MITEIDTALLQRWPLPQPRPGDGKDGRGRVLILAGNDETPGAARLAVDAALRAGAGRVTLATDRSIAVRLAIALPEARVIPLARLRREEFKADCVLAGPGRPDSTGLVERALDACGDEVPVILDARAMNVLRSRDKPIGGRVLITPHAGELAHLKLGTREAIEKDCAGYAQRAAQRWGVMVALKGPVTVIAGADQRCWQHQGGNPGLGVSGSGDVLAGLIAGLVARGAPLEQAAAWGVWLHARAGEALARKVGPLGYLARELAAEVPRLMESAQA